MQRKGLHPNRGKGHHHRALDGGAFTLKVLARTGKRTEMEPPYHAAVPYLYTERKRSTTANPLDGGALTARERATGEWGGHGATISCSAGALVLSLSEN